MTLTEGQIQIQIVDYLRSVFPEPCKVHHCKNEINRRGKSIARELARAKRKGVLNGFPDIIVMPFATVGPILFEVKAEGEKAKEHQEEMHADLRRLGYRVAVVRSVEDVNECLTEWSIPTQHVTPI